MVVYDPVESIARPISENPNQSQGKIHVYQVIQAVTFSSPSPLEVT